MQARSSTEWTSRHVGVLACALVLSALPSVPAAEPVRPVAREIAWEALVPAGWDPFKDMPASTGAPLIDGTPEALARMKALRAVWDRAPTNPALDGQQVKLPGYVVPLEGGSAGLKELLLVPYFGACIHSPPPPANQIVHVVLARPVKGFKAMDTVWATGTLGLARSPTEMGVSGYRMTPATLTRYSAPRR